jgi:ubiquinone/menaquinone biosynthesis C-methylase UbiE
MSFGGRIFAATYDRMIAKTEKAGLRAQRQALLASAGGQVLEIGGGTGANLPCYGADVESLIITEPEVPMVKRLQKRVRETSPLTTVLRAPAEDLPFNDDTFDTVVTTLVLCTVNDQPRALREIRRVLRPGGRLLFLEHVRAEDARLARLQKRMNGINRVVGHGCNCNRTTLDTIRATGFAITDLERSELKHAPAFVRPLVIGTATVASNHPFTATHEEEIHHARDLQDHRAERR